MCDYSLQHVASAPAKVGDQLVSTEFRHSATRGFTEIGAPDVAICLRSRPRYPSTARFAATFAILMVTLSGRTEHQSHVRLALGPNRMRV